MLCINQKRVIQIKVDTTTQEVAEADLLLDVYVDI